MTQSARSEGRPRVLVIGYSGANNTGAEALLLTDIEDLRDVLGPQASITVPSLDVRNLRRYLKESPRLSILRIPSIFFVKVWRLMKAHDALVLVEGSTFMDTWGSALLWYFLWAAWCARRQGKPCLAYAVDAGKLCRRNRYLTRRIASRMDLIVVRARAAAHRLRACGVTAPIEVSADNALMFTPDASQADDVGQSWAGATVAVGLAVVNFHQFPVRLRPFASKADIYRWPYAFSRSRDRTRAALALATAYAELADWIVEEQDRSVVLICMEELDSPFAEAVRGSMQNPDRVRVFSSRDFNASQMTGLLRSLDLLVTSRYHAAVLSLEAAVPQVAVGHDFRLRALYEELGLTAFFAEPHTGDLVETLKRHVRRLLADPEPVRTTLRRGHAELAARARRNRDHLRAFFSDRGWAL
jgi:polysaccharide pyruvyl transferase WcaK-like protein